MFASGAPVSREERARVLGRTGATIWITGLPAAGKSTLASGLERAFVERGRPALRLDGDDLRRELNVDLGFSRRDRAENVRRTAFASRLLADAGVVAIAALVSPYAADRERARSIHEEADLRFFEIFVDTPLATCERRDRKGLYARARRGELPDFTGVDAAYEPPQRAELTLRPTSPAALVTAALAAFIDGGVGHRRTGTSGTQSSGDRV